MACHQPRGGGVPARRTALSSPAWTTGHAGAEIYDATSRATSAYVFARRHRTARGGGGGTAGVMAGTGERQRRASRRRVRVYAFTRQRHPRLRNGDRSRVDGDYRRQRHPPPHDSAPTRVDRHNRTRPLDAGVDVRSGAGDDSIRIADALTDAVTIESGPGADTVVGGPGTEAIASGDDADFVHPGAGDDTVALGAGDDTAIQGDGFDQVESAHRVHVLLSISPRRPRACRRASRRTCRGRPGRIGPRVRPASAGRRRRRGAPRGRRDRGSGRRTRPPRR